MGYIDEVVKNHTMHSQERREKYQTFLAKTRPRKSGDVVRIDLIRAMAFVGETNFSEEAQIEFIKRYNYLDEDEMSPCAMVRYTEHADTHRGSKHVTYIMRMPKRGSKISEAKIDDGSIIVGGSTF